MNNITPDPELTEVELEGTPSTEWNIEALQEVFPEVVITPLPPTEQGETR